MKRRGWRVALTVATVGLALVAGLVALNWQTVRDHVEAWWFQATRETAAILPKPPFRASVDSPKDLLQLIADHTGLHVIFAAAERETLNSRLIPDIVYIASLDMALTILRERGYPVVEQHFPRRAYVVVGYRPTHDRQPTQVPSPRAFVSP